MTALARAEQADGEAACQALYDQAIVVFRAVLINRPELIRVRLELARTFFLKGRTDWRGAISSWCWPAGCRHRWPPTSIAS